MVRLGVVRHGCFGGVLPVGSSSAALGLLATAGRRSVSTSCRPGATSCHGGCAAARCAGYSMKQWQQVVFSIAHLYKPAEYAWCRVVIVITLSQFSRL